VPPTSSPSLRRTATRRARGEGTLHQRADGRWIVQVTYWEGGRRKRRTAYAATQAEARRTLMGLQGARDSGSSIATPRGSVESYLTEWLLVKQATLRPESARRYDDMVRLHIVPHIGRIRLAELTATDVETLIAKLRAAGLSNTTVAMAHGVLHKALNDAMRQRVVTANVATAATWSISRSGPNPRLRPSLPSRR
jgi:integrase